MKMLLAATTRANLAGPWTGRIGAHADGKWTNLGTWQKGVNVKKVLFSVADED